jgi:recombination protein RecT
MNDVKVLKGEIFHPAETRMREFGMPVEEIKKVVSFALQILNDPKNSYLAQSTRPSILKSVVNIASIGLTLNPVAKEAYLVPRKNNRNEVECHLEPSYIGLVKLVTNAGAVTSIQTNLVYERDEFRLVHNLSGADFSHAPHLGGDHGKIVSVYCVATLVSGEKQFERMTTEQVKAIRDKSESWKSYTRKKADNEKSGKKEYVHAPIWETDFGEMVRKTCLRRIIKYLPRSIKDSQKLDNAIKLANADFEPSTAQYSLADVLIDSSTLIEPQKENLRRQLPTCKSYDLELMIEYLQGHQPDPVQSGNITSMRDVHNGIDNAIERDRD